MVLLNIYDNKPLYSCSFKIIVSYGLKNTIKGMPNLKYEPYKPYAFTKFDFIAHMLLLTVHVLLLTPHCSLLIAHIFVSLIFEAMIYEIYVYMLARVGKLEFPLMLANLMNWI